MGALLAFLGWIFVSSYQEKRIALVSDLIRSRVESDVAAAITSRVPSSIESVVIGRTRVSDATALMASSSESEAQVAQFDLRDSLMRRGVSEEHAEEYGSFPFPSEFRSWTQKVAGFNARVELYFNVQTGNFVAFVWNN